MGDPYTTHVDPAAMDAAAEQFDTAADLISRAARARLAFDGASAGRAHTGDGDEFRRALDGLLADLNVWARAAAEIAMALRADARRYRTADQTAAARIG